MEIMGTMELSDLGGTWRSWGPWSFQISERDMEIMGTMELSDLGGTWRSWGAMELSDLGGTWRSWGTMELFKSPGGHGDHGDHGAFRSRGESHMELMETPDLGKR
jgi:hypothetical protein